MARTKDPHAAALKSWETRRRNAEERAGVRTRSQESSGGGPVQQRGDFARGVMSDSNPTGKFPKHASDWLMAHEEKHRGDAKEQAMLMTADGHFLYEKRGGKRTVVFSAEETAQMEGGVLTHNHPGGSPPSKDDLELVLRRGLREIRATAPDGTLYRLGVKGEPLSRWWQRELRDEFRSIHREVTSHTRDRIRAGIITVEEADANYPYEVHGMWTTLASRWPDRIYYKRTKGGA